MSTSRRRFLKIGMLATAFAAVPLRNVLSQSFKDRDGNPGEFPAVQSDALGTYTKATFQAYLNSVFELSTPSGIVAITLTEVGDLPSSRGGESFTLLFRGGSRPVRQGSYGIQHPSLGNFLLFLVPTGTDRNGAQGYLATLNRLSYVDVLNNPAPSRTATSPLFSGPSTTAPAPATTTATPSSTTTEPVATPTVTPATSAPKANRNSKRRKKPSWKNTDQRIL